MHVHSTFSDGRGTLEENVAEAERLGLSQLGCVDHVRVDTDWVPDYVAAVRNVREHTSVQMQCGIEAKILDTAGRLDMPDWVDGVDAVYAADHQVPSPDGPLHPRAVREGIESGELTADAVVTEIVTATIETVRVNSNVVIAHLFSILPKIGIEEATVDTGLIEQLADAAAQTGARIEIDERWSCPSARTVRPFIDRGVTLLLSTDSHRPETIGRYQYCRGVYRELTGVELTPVADGA